MRSLALFAVIGAVLVGLTGISCHCGNLLVKFPDGYELPISACIDESAIRAEVVKHDEIVDDMRKALHEFEGPPIVLRGPEGLVFMFAPEPMTLVKDALADLYPSEIATAIVEGRFAQGLGPYELERLRAALVFGLSADQVSAIFDNNLAYIARKAFADQLKKQEDARPKGLAESVPVVIKSVEERISEARLERYRHASVFCHILFECGLP